MDKILLPVLTVVVTIYDVVTYPIYWLVQQPGKKKTLAKKHRAELVRRGTDSVTYQCIRPNRKYYDVLTTEKINTVPKILRYTVKENGNNDCLGTREIIAEEDEVQPNGKVFKKYVMGDYKWRSYNDLLKEAQTFGRGLLDLGMEHKGKVVIFAETRAEWYISALGCFEQNVSIVTLYTSLGEEALVHGINETQAPFIVTSHELLPKLKNVLPRTPHVSKVIYMEDQLHKTDTNGYGNVDVMSYRSVCQRGSKSNTASHLPNPEDVAIIMYTSGSTGTPKGVKLSHWNIASSIASFTNFVTIDTTAATFIAYLPLAHVLELLAETTALVCGIRIGYSSALTMLDTSSKIKRGSQGDVTILKPILMPAVPLILDRIYKTVTDTVNRAGSVGKMLFKFATNYKVKWYKRGFDTPILNKLIFGKIRDIMGGNLKLILAGGAPLSPETQAFIRTSLCCDVLIGYGLTESSACCCLQDVEDFEVGRVGGPLQVCQVRLENWEEGNYRVDDKPYPRGEVIVGGDNVALGYYNMPEATEKDFFDEDGRRWFRTGDIGELHHDGVLKIIDRKKDLVKLQFGEYVSLGKVESSLKTLPLIEEICVYGDGLKTSVVALVVPSQQHLTRLATDLGINSVTYSNVCMNPDVIKAVLKELQNHAKKCKLEKFEIPSAITLCSEPWTPDTGLVTAAFKLKRRNIQDKFQKEIHAMYATVS